MKSIRNLVLPSFALLAAVTALSAKPIPGPKGGRVLTAAAPHTEFFVEKNRSVTVTFYDAALKLVAPVAQVVTVVAEAEPGKVTLEFERTASGFVSRGRLPDGDGYRIVVQIRENTAGRAVNHRFDFHEEICGECKRAEYACTCDEAGGSKHQH